MGLRHFAEFTEAHFQKRAHRINIYDKLWHIPDSEATEFSLQLPPTNLFHDAEDETLESPVRGSVLSLNIWEAMPDDYEHLFTSDDKRFELQYWIGGSLYWKGFLQTELMEGEYLANASVTLKATCGLGVLKNYTYEPIAELGGMASIMQILCKCLSNISTAVPGFLDYLYDGCYIFENNTTESLTQSALAQVYVHELVYYDDDDYLDCYSILEDILKRFHLYIIWQGDGFHLRQINQIKQESYTERRYNFATAAYIDNNTVSEHITISTTTVEEAEQNFFLDSSQYRTIYPAWADFTINQDYGVIEDLFSNRFINLAGREVETDYLRLRYNQGTAVAQSYGDEYYQDVLLEYVYSDNKFLALDINLSELVGAVADVRLMLITDDTIYYLKTDGEWSESDSVCLNIDSVGSDSITSDIVPDSGIVRVMFNIQPISLGLPTYVVDLDNSSISIQISEDDYYENETNTRVINSNNNESVEIDLLIGDVPVYENTINIYRGALYYLDGTDYIPTSSWHRYGEVDTATLNELIGDEYSINHAQHIRMLEGTLRAHFNALSVITESNKMYQIISMEYNGLDNEYEMVILEIGEGEGDFLNVKSGGYFRLKSGGRVKLKQ